MSGCNQHGHRENCPHLTGTPEAALGSGGVELLPSTSSTRSRGPMPAIPPRFGTEWDAEDGGGDLMPLRIGALDEDSDWLYKRGQCLALATEMSLRTGWPVHLEVIQEGEPERLDPTHPDFDPDYDEHEVYENLIHAYVRRPAAEGLSSVLIDISGENDPEIVAEDRYGIYDGLEPRLFPASEVNAARAHWESFISSQDYEAAAAFAEVVLNNSCLDSLPADDRRLLHAALLAHVDDNHAGGVMGWSEADYDRATALFDSLESSQTEWSARGLTDTGREALLVALVYPVHDVDHPATTEWTADVMESMLTHLSDEFGR